MMSFAKEDWFEVTEDNINNIRKRSFYGDDGLAVGHMAAYAGGFDDGFCVISKEKFEKEYGVQNEIEQDEIDR